VADGLRALTHETAVALAEAERSATDALGLIQINYQVGLVTYLQVLTVNAQVLQTRLGLIQIEAQRLQDTVALFAALGGGWWNRPSVMDGHPAGGGQPAALPGPGQPRSGT